MSCSLCAARPRAARGAGGLSARTAAGLAQSCIRPCPCIQLEARTSVEENADLHRTRARDGRSHLQTAASALQSGRFGRAGSRVRNSSQARDSCAIEEELQANNAILHLASLNTLSTPSVIASWSMEDALCVSQRSGRPHAQLDLVSSPICSQRQFTERRR